MCTSTYCPLQLYVYSQWQRQGEKTAGGGGGAQIERITDKAQQTSREMSLIPAFWG